VVSSGDGDGVFTGVGSFLTGDGVFFTGDSQFPVFLFLRVPLAQRLVAVGSHTPVFLFLRVPLAQRGILYIYILPKINAY
jgi:hypothetical protein